MVLSLEAWSLRTVPWRWFMNLTVSATLTVWGHGEQWNDKVLAALWSMLLWHSWLLSNATRALLYIMFTILSAGDKVSSRVFDKNRLRASRHKRLSPSLLKKVRKRNDNNSPQTREIAFHNTAMNIVKGPCFRGPLTWSPRKLIVFVMSMFIGGYETQRQKQWR